MVPNLYLCGTEEDLLENFHRKIYSFAIYTSITNNKITSEFEWHSQFSSVAQSCPTLYDPMDCSMPGLPVHHQHLEFAQSMSIESVMPSNHLILCRSLLLMPSIFPSIRVFSKESGLHIRWPKYWSFSFNISPSSEHPGLICFRMDWLDLLAVQGTLKSLLHTIVEKHQFFSAQLSLYSNSHIHTWPLEKL